MPLLPETHAPLVQSAGSSQSWRQTLPRQIPPRTQLFANMHAPPIGVVPSGRQQVVDVCSRQVGALPVHVGGGGGPVSGSGVVYASTDAR